MTAPASEYLHSEFSWPDNMRLHEDNTFGLITLDVEERNHFSLKYDGFEARFEQGECIRIESTGNMPKRYFAERIAIPFLRLLNGYLLLHASALSTPQGGVVFLAPSGIGKSTIAASLLTFPDIKLIADDIATISSGMIYPLSSQLAMRHAMADDADYVESVEFNGYKRLLNIHPDKVERAPVPLSCICLLESGKPSQFQPFSECLSQILAQQLKLSNPPPEFARAQFKSVFDLKSIPCLRISISCRDKAASLQSAQHIIDALQTLSSP